MVLAASSAKLALETSAAVAESASDGHGCADRHSFDRGVLANTMGNATSAKQADVTHVVVSCCRVDAPAKQAPSTVAV